MRFARKIRLRRVKCLRAWVDLFHFTLRSNISQSLCDYFTFARGANISLKYQLKRKNRLILIVSLFLFISAHLLLQSGTCAMKLSLRTSFIRMKAFLSDYISSNSLSRVIRQRGTWKGPLKVLPLQGGSVGLPSRRKYPNHSPYSSSAKCALT